MLAAGFGLQKSEETEAGLQYHDSVHYEEVGGHVYSLPSKHPEVSQHSATPKAVTATQQVHKGQDVPKRACEGTLYAVPKKVLQKEVSSTAEQAPGNPESV